MCRFKWVTQTSGYKLPNCLYKTGNTGVWVCRRAQAALLSPSRMCCYGCMGRLLQNFPPLNMLQVWTTLGKGYRQTKSNTPLEVPVRSQVWRTTEQSRRVRIQLERRWWKVRKPSGGLRNHVPPLGCSVASHGCQRVIVSSGGCGDWGHDEVCEDFPWEGKSLHPFSLGVSVSQLSVTGKGWWWCWYCTRIESRSIKHKAESLAPQLSDSNTLLVKRGHNNWPVDSPPTPSPSV